MDNSIKDNFYAHVAATSNDPVGIEIERAEGVYLYDKNGKSYLDMIAGISVCNLGHGNQDIINAVKKQVDKYMHLMVYGELIEDTQVGLASLLASVLPEQLSNVFFVNSGSEAVEGALKLAKRITKKSEIVYCDNAYHGCTQGAMSVMGNSNFKNSFFPLLPETKMISFGSKEDLLKITEKTACFIVEPVQGEAGVRSADNNYWHSVRKRCDETGALLIFDEIQTGLGRTGKLFCFEHYNIVPDILVLAKALGGGLPLGAFISSRKNMQFLTHDPVLGHISTFGGHPVSCAAGLTHLKIINDNKLWQNAEPVGIKLENIAKSIYGVKNVRRKGLLMAIDFEDEKLCLNTYKKWLNTGLFVDWFLFCPTAIRVAPPLIFSQQNIEDFTNKIR